MALVVAGAASAAHAEDATKWFVHAGPALVAPDESAKVYAAGSLVPGGSVSIASRWTFSGELGRFLTPNVAVAVAGGIPPVFKIDGAGSLAAVGTAGKVLGGPSGVFVQYHANRSGMIQPYVGVGAAVLVVFSSKDRAATNLHVDSAIGPAIQAGADVMLNGRWGIFGDVKKGWVKTTATGFLGPAPVRARITVDPLVTNFGVSYQF
jgi:outer membrane protein